MAGRFFGNQVGLFRGLPGRNPAGGALSVPFPAQPAPEHRTADPGSGRSRDTGVFSSASRPDSPERPRGFPPANHRLAGVRPGGLSNVRDGKGRPILTTVVRYRLLFTQQRREIYPVDTVLRRVNHHGYAHHIERLMVLGNSPAL